MLTNNNDMVFDPFAVSCVTGEVAEKMGRKWICCELLHEYVEGAKREIYWILEGNPINSTRKETV